MQNYTPFGCIVYPCSPFFSATYRKRHQKINKPEKKAARNTNRDEQQQKFKTKRLAVSGTHSAHRQTHGYIIEQIYIAAVKWDTIRDTVASWP